MSEVEAPSFRDECYRCHKAAVVCVCADIVKVATRTRIIVVQHPRERFHAIGTARFAKLGLSNSELVVAHGLELPEALLETNLQKVGLLYPDANSRALEDLPAAEQPEALVVLDGTWAQSRSLFRSTPWLQALPRYALHPKAPSQYRIRREPNEQALSTIEAIVGALQALEPGTPGLPELLAAFLKMIDRQVHYLSLPNRRPRYQQRRRPPRLSPALRATVPNWVLVFGEFAMEPEATSRAQAELVYWTALRLATIETFGALVRSPSYSERFPTGPQLRPMGLRQEDLKGAPSLAEFQERWRDFSRPNDVLVAWNHSTFEFWEGTSKLERPPVVLKEAYCNLRKRAAGALPDVLEVEGLAPIPTPFQGRAATILGQLHPVAQRMAELLIPEVDADPAPD